MFATAILLAVSGCYYDLEEELFEGVECESSEMSYQSDIAPIIATHCLVCHSASANLGNITLESHSDLKQVVESGRLLGAIKHLPGFAPMPQVGEKLSDCNLEKISNWVEDGAPE